MRTNEYRLTAQTCSGMQSVPTLILTHSSSSASALSQENRLFKKSSPENLFSLEGRSVAYIRRHSLSVGRLHEKSTPLSLEEKRDLAYRAACEYRPSNTVTQVTRKHTPPHECHDLLDDREGANAERHLVKTFRKKAILSLRVPHLLPWRKLGPEIRRVCVSSLLRVTIVNRTKCC